jgi:DNA-directed RNA polymerase subunit RPC12/RpoP
MAIVYRCVKCNKKFKVREYAQLESVHVFDGEHHEISDSQGKKCDSCDNTIRSRDKTCEA